MYCAQLIVVGLVAAVVVAAPSDDKKHCPGCPVDADPNDPQIKTFLTTVLANKNANVEITKVVKVTKQVVAGTKYEAEFEAKDSATNVKKLCVTKFVSQPWKEPKLEVLDFSCNAV